MDSKKYEYEVSLKNFDGPLDLLLFLIKDKKINIFDIDLLELAHQYINYIKKLEEKNLEIASEYLVMSATLILIKSRAILEVPQNNKELEKDKNKLLKELAEYQQFKMIKTKLRENEIIRKKIFTKTPDDLSEFIRSEIPSQLDGHSDPVKLIMIMRKMFERTHAQKLSVGIIDTLNLSPEERADEIRIMFKEHDELKFDLIFNVPTMKHFIVTLLALLDMSRKQEVILSQKSQFSEIRILKGGSYE